MNKEECFEIGYISKSHGYKGELFFLIKEGIPVKIKEEEWVFIAINGQLIPFLIDACRETGKNAWIVKLHDIDEEEKAKRLIKCSLYLLLSLIPEQSKRKFQPTELDGYKVIDEVKGEIGIVANVLDMPQQLILEVYFEQKKILIPANEDFITGIDHKKKIINLRAPEGLIDMYMES